MYRRFVAKQVRQLWSDINTEHVKPVLDIMADPFSYTFIGRDHPLAGTRVQVDTMREQLERVDRIFPGIEFTVRDLVVRGWPWKTVVGAQVEVRAPLIDGSTYRNELIQVAHLRWGKATHVTTTIDLGRLLPAYQRQSAAGHTPARLTPIIG